MRGREYVIPVDKTPWAIVEDVVADGVLAGNRLEISRCLLHPDTHGCNVIPLQAMTVGQQLSQTDGTMCTCNKQRRQLLSRQQGCGIALTSMRL